MVKPEKVEYIEPFRNLIEKDGSLYVPVSHKQLDDLIGRLMQMCDLTGDLEQRKALKDTIKNISRRWLDSLYEDGGYHNYEIIDPSKIIKV